MRKLIIILLITVIACAEVDNTPKEKVSDFNELLDLLDLDANSVELLFDWFTDFFNSIKGFFGNLWDTVKKPIELLKSSEGWDELYSMVKTGSKIGAVTLCSEYFAKDTCTAIIDGILKMIEGEK